MGRTKSASLDCSQQYVLAPIPGIIAVSESKPAIPLESSQQSLPVKCQVRELSNIHVPNVVSIPPRPSTGKPKASSPDAELLEDWNTDMADLFEWVGMACLGAQR